MVISEEKYNKSVEGKVGLRKTDQKLFGPGKFAFRVIDELEGMLTNKEHRRTRQNLCLINGKHHALLGLPVIRALGLIGKIFQKDIKLSFLKLFFGIGEIQKWLTFTQVSPITTTIKGAFKNMHATVMGKRQEGPQNYQWSYPALPGNSKEFDDSRINQTIPCFLLFLYFCAKVKITITFLLTVR